MQEVEQSLRCCQAAFLQSAQTALLHVCVLAHSNRECGESEP